MNKSEAALEALGDPTRREILTLLSRGPRSVREISDELPVTRPAVSHHLRVLREADLVSVEAEGTRRIYQIESKGLDQLREFVERVWGDAMARLKLVADNLPDEDERDDARKS